MKNAVFWDVMLCGSCKRSYVPLNRQFSQEPHGVTSQKTIFFNLSPIITTVQDATLSSLGIYFGVSLLQRFR
jgi:hypothetical protein